MHRGRHLDAARGHALAWPAAAAGVLVASAAGLGYQIALMRIWSIAQWHHFAYMIISVAMLGFGAAGTCLALLDRRVAGREERLLMCALVLFPVSMVACTALSQQVPFETFEVAAQRVQWAYLFLLYLLLALPFFLLSAVIALSLLRFPTRVAHTYAASMLGSGLGAGGVIVLLRLMRPGAVVLTLALTVSVWAGWATWRSFRPWGVRAGTAIMTLLILIMGPPTPRLSSYKGLSYALQYPDASVVAATYSPLAWLTVVRSERIRVTPGQIVNYPMSRLGRFPSQLGLFSDGAGPTAVDRFDGDLSPLAYLDYVTSAAPYHMRPRANVLVLGAGGGTDVLQALYQGAQHVDAVEVNPDVVALMRGPLRDFSGNLFARPDINVHVVDGRRFLDIATGSFDVIQMALLESFNASAAGVYALSEDYLLTTESLAKCLSLLTPHGVVSVTRWLKRPARDGIKMFATLVEACESAGVTEPERHVAFIRSWNTGTLIASPRPLSPSDMAGLRSFCDARGIDVCYAPGLDDTDVNRFTILEQPVYYRAARAILSRARTAFYRTYPFYVRPATDDRPHFARFFKWSSVHRYVPLIRHGSLSFVEWGYLVLLLTLIQAGVAGAVLVLWPLGCLRKRTSGAPAGRVAAYFLLLGFAYMFMEIACIQKFMLFLAQPVYAVATVLTGFLMFSGLGSYVVGLRHRPSVRLVGLSVGAIALVSILYAWCLPVVFHYGGAWSVWGRTSVALAVIAPLAFCMGIPMPAGLTRVTNQGTGLVALAWGANGCASVIGAAMATCLAVHFGFRAVVAMAVAAYAMAALTFIRMTSVAVPNRGSAGRLSIEAGIP